MSHFVVVALMVVGSVIALWPLLSKPHHTKGAPPQRHHPQPMSAAEYESEARRILAQSDDFTTSTAHPTMDNGIEEYVARIIGRVWSEVWGPAFAVDGIDRPTTLLARIDLAEPARLTYFLIGGAPGDSTPPLISRLAATWQRRHVTRSIAKATSLSRGTLADLYDSARTAQAQML